jgi:hypothetical protein
MPSPQKSSRREFGRALAAAAVAPLAAAPHAIAADDIKIPRDLLETADAQVRIVQARFGKLLTQEQMKEVVQSVIHGRYAANALARVKLRNGDEPSFAFRADLP